MTKEQSAILRAYIEFKAIRENLEQLQADMIAAERILIPHLVPGPIPKPKNEPLKQNSTYTYVPPEPWIEP